MVGLAGLRAPAARSCPTSSPARSAACRRRDPHARAVGRVGRHRAAGTLDLPLVPADRGSEGLVAEFSVRENLTLPLLDRLKRAHRAQPARRERGSSTTGSGG